jgi:3-oxoadipate enol-lactonase
MSGGLRIAYELRGTLHRRRPWLLLIQGMGFDRSGWGPVLRNLRRQFRLVLADNAGTGSSDRRPGTMTVADMAADVVAVLGAARIGRAHVLGVSLGGMVAQELAITHPERVDRLVLACTTPGWPATYPMPRGTVRLIAATAGVPRARALRRHVTNALGADTVRQRPELVDRIVRLQLSRPRDSGALLAQAAAGVRYAGRRRRARIRAHTLVLQGGADNIVDPRNGWLLANGIPGARLVTFPRLGHLLFWEDPDGFAAAASAFLLARPGRSRPRRAALRHGSQRAAASRRGPRPARCRRPAARVPPPPRSGRRPVPGARSRRPGSCPAARSGRSRA